MLKKFALGDIEPPKSPLVADFRSTLADEDLAWLETVRGLDLPRAIDQHPSAPSEEERIADLAS